MNVKKAIIKRRAYRSLDSVDIDSKLIRELTKAAQLAPSCFNHQPWYYVFAYDPDVKNELHQTVTEKNKWVENSSLIVAVYSNKEEDCNIKNRHYYLFDTGLATGFLILRATEFGLVAHPIAGFKEELVKKILKIPEEMTLITLVIIGKKSKSLKPELTESQKEREKERPTRKNPREFVSINYHGEYKI